MTTWDEGARAARKGLPLSANPWNSPGRNSRQMTVERKASEWDEGYKITKESLQPQTARICTSGGASTYCPGLGIAIAEAYRAMQAGVKGEHRPYVAPRAELEEELLAWRAKFNNLSYQFGELTTAPV